EIDFSDEKLTCFYGENEAGKSTLQQFLLYMLFGLEPKKRKFYRPKNRTEIGGSLNISDHHLGMITIHRKEEDFKCLLENGQTKEEVWCIEKLAGLTRDVYASIYAFSAVDLRPIQTMKAKELSDILFSVGLTGSTGIYEVEKRLLTQMDHLYKGRGKKPLLNKQIIHTEKAFQLLREEQEKEASYQNLIQQIETNQKNLHTTQREVDILQKEIMKHEKIMQILPDIHELYHVNQEWKEIPKEISFPKDGVERLRSVKE